MPARVLEVSCTSVRLDPGPARCRRQLQSNNSVEAVAIDSLRGEDRRPMARLTNTRSAIDGLPHVRMYYQMPLVLAQLLQSGELSGVQVQLQTQYRCAYAH